MDITEKQVKNIARLLQSSSQSTLSYMQSLEEISKVLGYTGWNSLKPVLSGETSKNTGLVTEQKTSTAISLRSIGEALQEVLAILYPRINDMVGKDRKNPMLILGYLINELSESEMDEKILGYILGKIFLKFPGDNTKFSMKFSMEANATVKVEIIATYIGISHKMRVFYINRKADYGNMIADIKIGFSSAIFQECKSYTEKGDNLSFVKGIFPILTPEKKSKYITEVSIQGMEFIAENKLI